MGGGGDCGGRMEVGLLRWAAGGSDCGAVGRLSCVASPPTKSTGESCPLA